jgi:DNA mismatch endonuclease, patch repair protein
MPAMDTPSESKRRAMQAQRVRDTVPEMELRRELNRRGLRYRVDLSVLPRRKADIVFTRSKLAVFVDGCFWHGCPMHGTWPQSNAAWWRTKIERNRERDAETSALLVDAGWGVVRVWEHEDPVRAASRVAAAVERRRRVLPPVASVRQGSDR